MVEDDKEMRTACTAAVEGALEKSSQVIETHLLNAGNCVDGELLEGALQLLVISGGRSVDDLLLPASCALKKAKH